MSWNPIAWWRHHSAIHGNELMVIVSLVYFMQGARGYMLDAAQYIGALELNMDESPITFMLANAQLIWNFKWAIGLISDNLPIMGYNIKPYLVLCIFVGMVTHPLTGIQAVTNTPALFAGVLIAAYGYGAVADVLADALVIKNGRADEEDSSSALQSLSWFSLGVGGAIATIVGGYLATDPLTGEASAPGSRIYLLGLSAMPVILLVFALRLKEAKTTEKPGFKALIKQVIRLFVAFLSPPFIVLRTSMWVMISNTSMISYYSLMRRYQTKFLGFSPLEMSWIDVSSYVFLAIGTVIYYRFLRHTPFLKIFFWTQILFALVAFLDYPLIKRWNVSAGIPDFWFMLFSTSFASVAERFNVMPMLVMSAQLCPEHMEATFFALLMSLSNQGSYNATSIGGALLAHFGVGTDENPFGGFDNLILIKVGATAGVALLAPLLLPNTCSLSPPAPEELKPTWGPLVRILKYADMYHVGEDGVGRVHTADKVPVEEKGVEKV